MTGWHEADEDEHLANSFEGPRDRREKLGGELAGTAAVLESNARVSAATSAMYMCTAATSAMYILYKERGHTRSKVMSKKGLNSKGFNRKKVHSKNRHLLKCIARENVQYVTVHSLEHVRVHSTTFEYIPVR